MNLFMYFGCQGMGALLSEKIFYMASERFHAFSSTANTRQSTPNSFFSRSTVWSHFGVLGLATVF